MNICCHLVHLTGGIFSKYSYIIFAYLYFHKFHFRTEMNAIDGQWVSLNAMLTCSCSINTKNAVTSSANRSPKVWRNWYQIKWWFKRYPKARWMLPYVPAVCSKGGYIHMLFCCFWSVCMLAGTSSVLVRDSHHMCLYCFIL